MTLGDTLNLQDVLQIAEIFSILGGGGLVAFKLGRTTSKVEASFALQNAILENQTMDISDLKKEIKKLGEVLTTLAVQSNRIDRIEADLRDLRYGKGFVNPG